MSRGLVGDHVRDNTPQHQLRIDVRSITDQTNGFGRLIGDGLLNQRHRFLQCVDHHIHIADIQAAESPFGIHLYDQAHTFVHRDRQGLCAAHTAQTSC